MLVVTMGQEDFAKTGRRHCALACVCLVVVLGTALGFLAGLLVGGLLATHTRLASEGQEKCLVVYKDYNDVMMEMFQMQAWGPLPLVIYWDGAPTHGTSPQCQSAGCAPKPGTDTGHSTVQQCKLSIYFHLYIYYIYL